VDAVVKEPQRGIFPSRTPREQKKEHQLGSRPIASNNGHKDESARMISRGRMVEERVGKDRGPNHGRGIQVGRTRC